MHDPAGGSVEIYPSGPSSSVMIILTIGFFCTGLEYQLMEERNKKEKGHRCPLSHNGNLYLGVM